MLKSLNITAQAASNILAVVIASEMIVFWYRGTPDNFTWPWLLPNLFTLWALCFTDVKIVRFLKNTPDSPQKTDQVIRRVAGSSMMGLVGMLMAFLLGTMVAGGVRLNAHHHIAGWSH